MQDMAPEVRKRPFGRSLQHCRKEGMTTPHGLWPAEEKLLKAAWKGEPCILGQERLDAATEDNKVSALFLRFLLLGGDEDAPVPEKGVELTGAFIDGDIDLQGVADARPLYLDHCQLDGKLLARNARLGELLLPGCHIRGMNCDGAKITGGVSLNDGFTAEGEVSLLGTEIGGDLSCSKGTFKNANGDALSFDGAKVTGDALFNDGFAAEGQVRLLGAEIRGELNCRKGTFKNADGYALSCYGATVTGSMFLDDGFTADGEVSLSGAEIRGDLSCSKGTFKNAERLHCPRRGEPLRCGTWRRA
jgi:hypothetical protein